MDAPHFRFWTAVLAKDWPAAQQLLDKVDINKQLNKTLSEDWKDGFTSARLLGTLKRWWGDTLLHVSARNCLDESVKFLLGIGADQTIKNVGGQIASEVAGSAVTKAVFATANSISPRQSILSISSISSISSVESKRSLVDYDGEKRAVEISFQGLDSLEGLTNSLKEKLNVTSEEISVSYWNEELKEHVILESMDDIMTIPHPKLLVKPSSRSWWDLTNLTNEEYVLVMDHLPDTREQRVISTKLYGKFQEIAPALGIDANIVDRVYAISNKNLLSMFTANHEVLTLRIKESSDLFRSTDWQAMDHAEQREAYLKRHRSFASQFPWNVSSNSSGESASSSSSSSLPVIPMLQGTSEEAILKIASQGVGNASLTDEGYFGKGIYFTSKLSYATHYSRLSSDQRTRCFLIAMITPGNPFPITEHPFDSEINYKGCACRSGYQSHLTMVKVRGVGGGFPVLENLEDAENVADELAVFESSYILPLFAFFLPLDPDE